MGVRAALGYQHKAATDPSRYVFDGWLEARRCRRRPTDRRCRSQAHRQHDDRHTLAGLPVVYLYDGWPQSGQPLYTLIAVLIGDDFALLGTNFGGKRTPGWVFNLEAEPHVKLGYRTTEIDVVARPPPPMSSKPCLRPVV